VNGTRSSVTPELHR